MRKIIAALIIIFAFIALTSLSPQAAASGMKAASDELSRNIVIEHRLATGDAVEVLAYPIDTSAEKQLFSVIEDVNATNTCKPYFPSAMALWSSTRTAK